MFRPISWRKQAEKAERRTRYCELSEFSLSTARITTETKAGVISAAPHARFIATMPTSGKKHPQWVLLVHSSGTLAFRLVAFAPFQGARLSAPESAALPPPHVLSVILRMQNLFFICPTSRREHIRRVEKAPAMGAFGTLVGDRTRICGSGGHRSIRYTTSAELFNLYIILYSGAGVKRLRQEQKRKLTRKAKAALFPSAAR